VQNFFDYLHISINQAKNLAMYFRISLLMVLNIISILLPAQNIENLKNTIDSINIEKAILLQKIEELELIEKEYLKLIEESRLQAFIHSLDLRPVSDGEVVEHTYYTLSYSEENEQAEWVYYILTDEMLAGTTSRTDNFKADQLVSTLSAGPTDYEGTGYDRGHLCPAGDMTLNLVAMSESFYMSNMSPQAPSFNRGIWQKLEGTVRNWAHNEKVIHVVTGPVFKDNLGVLPDCGVTIPGYFYKVVFDSTGEQKMIAFVLPNAKGVKQLPEYVVTVNNVENLTGIDFFAALPDSIETRLEANSNASLWEFKEFHGAASVEGTTVQCMGLVKSTGVRCRNNTTNENGYCHLHQAQAP
jgi:endonuclease G, mitochondrial